MEENIIWINPNAKEGTATLGSKSILLNTIAASSFQNAYRAKVGVNQAKRRIIIKPLTRDQIEKGFYEEDSLLHVQVEKSFTKISSVELMRSIASLLELTFSKQGEKYPTKWDEEQESLYIEIGKEGE